MSNKFYATDGYEYWKPDPAYKEQKLALLEDGTLAVLTNMMKEGWTVTKLDTRYEYTEIAPTTETKEEVEKVSCPTCSGSGEVMEIVDHDHDYNSVWETRQCWRCHGTGQIIKK